MIALEQLRFTPWGCEGAQPPQEQVAPWDLLDRNYGIGIGRGYDATNKDPIVCLFHLLL